jgi:hypothetical protein
MSFTSLEIVRKHILEKHLGVNRVDQNRFVFEPKTRLSRFSAYTRGVGIVKSITRHRPEFQVAAFGSSNEISLSESRLSKIPWLSRRQFAWINLPGEYRLSGGLRQWGYFSNRVRGYRHRSRFGNLVFAI